MAEMYAWSDLYGGGTVEEVKTPTGGIRRVVTQRNVTPRGEKVTRKKLDVSEEEWEALIENGSVRPYPLPDEADDYLSPSTAVVRRVMKNGEIDPDILLQMSLANPPAINPPAEEGAEVPTGV